MQPENGIFSIKETTVLNQAQLKNGRFPIRETPVLDLDKV
jgi:hypothetical protein